MRTIQATLVDGTTETAEVVRERVSPKTGNLMQILSIPAWSNAPSRHRLYFAACNGVAYNFNGTTNLATALRLWS